MQSYNGTKYDPSHSSASIHQMIVDGTQGTQYGPGVSTFAIKAVIIHTDHLTDGSTPE